MTIDRLIKEYKDKIKYCEVMLKVAKGTERKILNAKRQCYFQTVKDLEDCV